MTVLYDIENETGTICLTGLRYGSRRRYRIVSRNDFRWIRVAKRLFVEVLNINLQYNRTLVAIEIVLHS